MAKNVNLLMSVAYLVILLVKKVNSKMMILFKEKIPLIPMTGSELLIPFNWIQLKFPSLPDPAKDHPSNNNKPFDPLIMILAASSNSNPAQP